MTSLREFFSLPFGSRGAGEDTPVGVDELGRTVYEDARGQRYVMTEAAPITPGDIRGAIAGGAQAFADDPVGAGGNALAALAAAAWNGIEAPANALRGDYMTYGDVADTALDWGVLGAAGSAPQGALRAGNWGRLNPQPGQGFDDWLDAQYATDARAARAAGELPPVVQPDVYYRGVSLEEMAAAERAGTFSANGRGVFVADDPTRYTGGGAYGARRGGHIVEFDTAGMDTIPMRGGLGTGDDFGFQEIPLDRVARVWDWDDMLGQHVLRNADAAETPAQTVARLLREGRASEVTDDLMAQADDYELFRLYESGATGMDMPMDEASRLARAREMGFDTDAYHATRATENFDQFQPGWRGSTYFAATPQRAQSGALGGAQDFSQVEGPASTAIMPVRLPGDDVARLRPSRQQWDALPERPFILDEAELAASVGARYPDDVFQPAMSSTGDVISVRRPFPEQQYAADVRNWTGEMLPGWNEGSDAAALERVAQRSGQRGFLVSDEAGASIVAGPDMPIRSRFARFDPRLSHLANLSAGVAAAGVALPYLADDERADLNALRAYIEGY